MVTKRSLVFKISKYVHEALWLVFKISKYGHKTIWMGFKIYVKKRMNKIPRTLFKYDKNPKPGKSMRKQTEKIWNPYKLFIALFTNNLESI